MSVINKMLDDLDARGMKAARSDLSDLRPVSEGARRSGQMPMIALGGGALIALGLAVLWYVKAPTALADQPLAQLARLAPAPERPLGTVLPLVVPTPVPVADAVDAVAIVALTELAPVPPAPQTRAPTPARPDAADAARLDAARPGAARPDAVRRGTAPSRRKPEPVELRLERPEPTPVRIAKDAQSVEQPRPGNLNNLNASDALADSALQTKQSNPRQEAENEYRKALVLIQDGRVTSGVRALEQTLNLSPRHDAARQTLIGLLLEARHPDEAMLQLERGLTFDAGQTAMAMTLARLQVERNGPALQTLQNSLPYAQDNAEYQGFFAALLQRAQRHAEAVEHYTAALQINPANGIWWMGLGISLQAQKNLSGAREALQKAKASGNLGGEMSAYVDKRLYQLGR